MRGFVPFLFAVGAVVLVNRPADGQILLGINAGDDKNGVEIVEILDPKGNGIKMGLQVGDLVVRLNGTKYTRSSEFAAALSKAREADLVWRRGASFYRARAYYQRLATTGGDKVKYVYVFKQTEQQEVSPAAAVGITLGVNLKDDDRGTLIASVTKGGWADRLGLRPGDRAVRVNDTNVNQSADMIAAVRYADTAEIEWERNGRRYQASVWYKDKNRPDAGFESKSATTVRP